jgi:hypothetical protein
MDLVNHMREIPFTEWIGPWTFEVAGTRYAAGPPGQVSCPDAYRTSLTSLERLSVKHEGDHMLVTVLAVASQQRLSDAWIEQTLDSYRSHDDVFNDEFLRCVIFRTCGAIADDIERRITSLLEQYGNQYLYILPPEAAITPPAPGLYILSHGLLHEAYRLYEDEQRAFLTPVLQLSNRLVHHPAIDASNPPSTYWPLGLAGEHPETGLVAVPSRIKKYPGSTYLDGLRIAVKDNFHVNGLRTSLCNRAYFGTYGPQDNTAPCIAKLVDQGARLVGTTKLAAFAATEEPLECVDYQAPWNPRGDGYQSPAGSSSGSGVAVASYDWLDIGIGTDSEYSSFAEYRNSFRQQVVAGEGLPIGTAVSP